MLKVDYIRDGLSEEFHTGLWVLAKPVKGFKPDESDTPFYLRSCAKPLQATLLVDNKINLTSEELALCCSSHAGEDCHIKVANKILKKFKLNDKMLKCGIVPPLSKSMQNMMIIREEEPTTLHNNCSGKHLGFLALCQEKDWDMLTYDQPNHPLQIAVKQKIDELCGVTQEYPMTTDGCGVPIVSMPLRNLVQGYMNLLNYPRILNAIKINPYIFGGEGRTDTEIIKRTENLIAKVGAGGLCVVLNVRERNAFAVKIHDANMDARRFALYEIINRLGWGELRYDNRIKTNSGKVVGQIVVSFYLNFGKVKYEKDFWNTDYFNHALFCCFCSKNQYCLNRRIRF